LKLTGDLIDRYMDMTIVTANTPGQAAPVGDPLTSAIKASERALRSDNVPAALKFLADFIERADRIFEVYKDRLDCQLFQIETRIRKKTGDHNTLLSGCLVTRGKLYQKSGDLGAANQQFAAARKLDPGNACIPLYLGINYETIIRPEQAADYFNQAIEINQKAPGENNRHCAGQAVNHLMNIADFLKKRGNIMNEAKEANPRPESGDR
jgi:tetratricopeptide (TPR) repeat protein